MKLKRAQLVHISVALGSILLGCALLLLAHLFQYTKRGADPGLLERLECLTYDPRVRYATSFNNQSLATNLGCLFLDDTVVQRVNDGLVTGDDGYAWPWPRFIHGWFVKELAAQGAKAVGFDIFFPEPFRRDPIVKDEQGEDLPSDRFFATEIAAAKNVVLGMTTNLPPAPIFMNANPALGNIGTVGESVMRRDRPYFEQRFWNPKIRQLAFILKLDLTNFVRLPGKIRFNPLPNQPPETDPQPHDFLLTKSGMLKVDAGGELSADEAEPELPSTERPEWTEHIWSLGLALGARALDLDLDHAVTNSAGHLVLTSKSGLRREIPLDHHGFYYIDWNLNLARLKSMASISNPPVYFGDPHATLVQAGGRKKDPTLETPFKDRVVVIGSIIEGNNITDMGATPLDESKTPLVIKHVNVANSLLTGVFVTRCTWLTELLIILLLGPLTAYITWTSRVPVGIAATIGLIASYVIVATWLYVQHRYWLTIVVPVTGAFLLPFASFTTYRVLFEQDEKKHIRTVFSRMVAPDVVNEMLGKENLSLGGARRNITIYFADVRGFTEFTDRAQAAAEDYVKQKKFTTAQAEAYFDQQAAETLATVNMYLSTIADMVKKHNGTLDKYIGDCVMAFWGAPLPNEQHALCCVRAAIDSQRAMAALNEERAEENKHREADNIKRIAAGQEPQLLLPLLSLGSGINSGTAIAGVMGSAQHQISYTVFGREVNLASRLEGYSGRGRIIISESTFRDLQRDDPELAAKCNKLEPVTPKGFREPIANYEVIWKETKVEATPADCSPKATKTNPAVAA